MNIFKRLSGAFGSFLLASVGLVHAQPNVRILPLGDSITLGCCSETSAQGGYRNTLYTSLVNAGYTVDFLGSQTDSNNPPLPDRNHQGHSAFTINDIRAGIPGWLNGYSDPDVILLHLGTNDFTNGLSTVADVQGRLGLLIREINVLRPYARIVISSLLPRTDIPASSAAVDAYNLALPQVVADLAASGYPVHYLDMHSTFLPADLNDGLHPTVAGYAKMASLWLPAVTSIISPVGTSYSPEIARASAGSSLTSVSVEFTKPISDASAVPGNFTIGGGVTVSGATLDASKRIVTLTTSTQAAGTLFTLSVTGVRDRTPQQNLISTGAQKQFTSRSMGDPSFELDNASWTVTGNAMISSGSGATQGTNAMVFNAAQASPNGVVSQSLNTVSGQVYRLSFDLGVLGAATAQALEVRVEGAVPASPLVLQTTSKTGPGSGPTLWETVTYEFTADSATTQLSFRDVSATSLNVDLSLDHVRLTVKVTPTLTVNSTPALGSTITVSPNDLSANGNGTTSFSRTYNENALVTLTAPATASLINFEKWQRDGLDYGTALSVGVPMDANHTMTAVYAMPKNGSFEDGTPDVNGVVSSFPSWTGSGAFFGFVGNTDYVPTNGNRLVVFNGLNAAPSGVISQAIPTTIGQSYVLKFKMGVVYGAILQQLKVDVVGSSSLVSVTHDKIHTNPGAAQWEQKTHVFVANSASTTVTFSDVSPSTAGVDLLLDEVTLEPSAANTAPVAVSDSYVAAMNTPLVVPAAGVLANDTDAESNTLTAVKVVNALPANGGVVLNSNGGFTYTPNTGFTGSDSFTYTASDGSLSSNVATVSITVNAASSQLIVNGGFEAGTPNGSGFVYSIPSWTTSGPVIFAYDQQAPYLAQAGNRLLVFNDGGNSGSGSISQTFPTVIGQTYQLEFYMKANGPTQQTVQVDIGAPASIFSGPFSVGAAAWELKSQSFVATSASTTLMFTDISPGPGGSDLLLDSVSVTGSGSPSRVLSVSSTVASAVNVIVSPADLASLGNGITAFSRNYADGTSVTLTAPATSGGLNFVKWQQNGSDLPAGLVATVSMNADHTLNAIYAAVNVAPVAVNDSYSTGSGVPLVVPAAGVLANDSDLDSPTLTAIKVVNSLPTNGSLILSTDGGFTYTPDSGFTGSDSFTYTANDGSLNSNVATVTITVGGAPSVQLLQNPDFEIGTPASGVISPVPSWTLSGPVFGYVGDANYIPNTGTRLLVFNDGNSNGSGEISQSFPTQVGQTYQLQFYQRTFGASPQTVRIDINGTASIYSDTRTAGSAAWELQSQSFVATSATTTLKFTDVSTTANTADLMLDSVSVTGPGSRVLSVTSTVASAVDISVSPVDLAAQGNGTTAFTRNYTDNASVTLTAPATSGGFTFVKWQQNGADLPAGLVASVSMNANLTLNAVYAAANVAPVAQDDSYSTNAGVQLVIDAPGVLGNDTDADSPSMTAIKVVNSLPANGTLVLSSDGAFTYTPANGFSGSDSFTYTANDGSLNSNVATVSITVSSVSSIQLLQNRDFEIGTPVDRVISPVPSWVLSGPVFGYVGNSNDYIPNAGDRLLVFNNGQANGSGEISQSFPTQVGQTYQLQFYQRTFGASPQTVRIDINGTASIYSDTRTAGSAAWELQSQSFVATSATTTLKFTDVSTTANTADLMLDNVSVTGPGSRVLSVTSTVASAVDISVSPVDLAAQGNGTTAFTRNYTDNASVTLTAPATSGGFTFVKWQQNGIDLPAGVVASVSMDADHTLNAVYAAGNVAPVAQDDSYSATAGVQLVINAPGVLSNDTDVDSPSLTAIKVVNASPTNGTLVLSSDGGFTYTPANGFTGSDSFTYTAYDGSLNSNVATVTIAVNAPSLIQLLQNRDFEVGTPAGRVISPVPSWILSGPVFGYVGSPSDYIANAGDRLLVFNNGQANGSGEISQSFPTQVGQTYQLEFYQRTLGSSPQTVRIDIDGAASIYSDTRTAGSAAWELKSQSFVATSTTTTLKFTDVSTNANLSDLLLDSVSVTGPGSRALSVTSTVASAVNIIVSPVDLTSQGNGATPFNRSYTDNASVTLTAPATSGGFSFVKWQQNGIDLPAGLVASVSMDADHVLNAVYAAANVAPVAQNDSYLATAGVQLVVPAPGVLSNDTDANSPSLTAIKVVNSLPTNGTLVLSSDGGFTYTPANGFTGSDSFTYTANDGSLNSNVATVTITVTQPAVELLTNGSFEAGSAPVDDVVSVVTGWTRTGGQIGYVGTGSYTPTNGQRLILFNPGNTTVQDGVISQSFATTPGQAYLLRYETTALGNGVQKLGVTVEGAGVLFSGDSGDLTGTGFGTPTWVERSHYFVANSEVTTLTLRDLSTTGTMVDLLLDNVRVNASNARGLLVTSSGASALGVTVSPSDLNSLSSDTTPFGRSYLQGASVTLTAPATSGGLDFVRWQRNGVDFPGGRIVTVTMDANYTFNAVYLGNTAPVAANNTYSTPEGVTLEVPGPGVLGNDTDGEANTLSAVLVAAPATGTFNLNSDGGFTYAPVPLFNGTVSFTYQANDGSFNSNIATVFITIGSAPPVVVLNNSFEIGTPDGSGVIAPIPSWTRSGPVAFAYVGSGVYLPDVGKGSNFLVFNNGQPTASGSVSQEFATTPGQAYLLEFHMGVFGTPDQKVRVQLMGTSQLISTDVIKTGSTNGSTTWQTKFVQFTADSAMTTLTLSDVSDTAAGVDLLIDDVRVSVIGGNTAPVAVDDSYSTVQQVPITILAPGVLGNDSDPQADPISPILVSGPSNGNLEGSGLNSNGSFTYTPNPSFSGIDTFTYKLSDTLLDSNIATVSITVTPGLPNLLTNGGFEQGSPANVGPLTGWTQSGIFPAPGAPFGYVPDVNYPATTSDGIRLLVMNGAGGAFGGSVSQTFATTIGQAYALDLNLGVFSGGVVGKKQALQVTVAGNNTQLSTLEVATSTAGPAQLVSRNYAFVADSTTTTITLLDASSDQSPNDAADLLVDLVRIYTIDNVRTLTVTTSASGLGVGVSPNDLAGAGAGVSSFTRTFLDGDVVTLNATQFDGANVFQKWQLDGNDVTPFNPTTSVTINGNQSLNAVYVIDNTPRATPDSFATDEDVALTVPSPGVLANDFNPNGLPLAAILENAPSPAEGNLTLSSNGSFVFVPTANFSGVANFTYRVSYGSSNSAPVTVTINVNTVNEPAMAVTQSVVTNEDTAVDITLAAINPDGNPLNYVVVDQPAKGILSGSGANRTYTPNLNANGPDSFTFTVNDGSGPSAAAIVSIMVTPVNDLPVVTARTFTMVGGTTQAIVFSGTDVDNDPLTFAVASGPTQGTVTGNSPNFIYIPNPTFTGSDSFTYVANDGFANSLPVNVSVTVSGILSNGSFENPLSGNWVVSPTSGAAFDITTVNSPTDGTRLARFNSANAAPNGSISQSIVTRPGFPYTLQFDLGATGLNGRVQRMTVSAVGSSSVLNELISLTVSNGLIWTPRSLSFTANSALTELRFTDSSLTSDSVDMLLDNVRVVPQASRRLQVNSTPINGVPVTTNAPTDLNGAVAGTINSQFNRYYPLLSSHNIILAVPATASGSSFQKWQRNGADFAGNTSLSTSLTLSADTIMTAVYQANQVPVPVADSYSTNEDVVLVVPALTGVLANDSDPEFVTLTASVVSAPTRGMLSLDPDGGFTYTPNPDSFGPDSFTYRASDGVVQSAITTVSLMVNSVNDLPIFTVDPIEGTPTLEDIAYISTIAGSATDIETNVLTYSKVSGPAWLLIASNGVLLGTPGNSDVGNNSFIVRAIDGNGASVDGVLNVVVNNVNDPPQFTSDPIVASGATEDENYVGSLAGFVSDIDVGDSLTYEKVSGPSWLVVAPNGALSGAPGNSDVGANAFVVRVTDGSNVTDEAALDITVVNVNDAPTFTVNPMTGGDATEDSAYTGTISGSATDIDLGDTLTYSKVSGPSWLQVAGDGTLSGTPLNEDVGINEIVIAAIDASLAVSQATLNITVLNVNDAPQFISDPAIGGDAIEDEDYVGTLVSLVNEVDVGDTLTFVKTDGPTWLQVAPNGALSGSPSNSDVGLNTFSVTVTDGNSPAVSAVFRVTVINANDAPEFTLSSMSGADATEDLEYTGTITGSATDVDLGDSLTYSKFSGPSWLQVASDGTLSGTPLNEHVGANSFVVSVTDSSSAVGQATLNITVLNVNDAPTFVEDPTIGSDAAEDALYTATLVGVATDVDTGATLTYSDLNGPSWLTLGLDGSLSGTPGNSDVGVNRFTVKVSDGIAPPVQGNIDITVVNTNDAPEFVIDPIASSATEDEAYSGTLLTAVIDIDVGDTLIYTKVSGPSWLIVAANGQLSGMPLNEDVGFNEFVVQVTDGAMVSDTAVLNITVANENDAPTFVAAPTILANATEDLAYTGTVLGSAVDVDLGSVVTYSNLTGPSWLTLAVDGSLSGTPSNSEVGLNVFTVEVSDGIAPPVQGTLHVTVINTNDAPTFTADPISRADATEDVAYSATLEGSGTDVDQGATLTYALVSGPSWLTVGSNGALSGTPLNEHVGPNAFTVSVTDGLSPVVEATLNITVINVNDAPTFTANPISGADATEDVAYSATLAGTATDVDGGAALTYALVSGPSWLTVGSNGALSGTPLNEHVGANSFTVSVTDGQSTAVEATLNITVINANDAPTFTADPISRADATEDVAYSATLEGSATDADQGATLTYALVSGPSWLTVGSNGALSGTPLNEHVGPNAFTVSVTDGIAPAVQATLNITVINVNDVPTFAVNPISGANATEDVPYSATLAGFATDADQGATLTYALVSGPSWLTVASNGALSGTPLNEHVGPNAFTVSVTDGIAPAVQATLNITVTNVNDAPTFTANPIVGSNATEDLVYSATIEGSATDMDQGDSLTYSKVSGPAWLTVSSSGVLSGTPLNEHVGINSFVVRATDAANASVTANLTITVINVNDAPVANSQSVSVNEDSSLNITLTASDVDGPGPLVLTSISLPTNGFLSGSYPNIIYTPRPNYSGPDSFNFIVNDGIGNSLPATVSINVVSVIDDNFANWLSGFGATGNPGDDLDRDSISNAIEFVIGGNPQNRMDVNLLPTISMVRADPDQNASQVDYLLFTYRLTDLARADEKTTIHVQWNPLLTGNWTNAVGTPGVVVLETNDGAAPGVDLVQVYIPRSLAVNGKLFARLSVSIDVPPVNALPVAQAQTVSMNENSSRPIVLAATDANGQPLSYRIVTNPTRGILSGLAPNMTYTPTPNTSGSDSFTFVANDGIADSIPATVSITVNPVHQFNQWMSTFNLVAPANADSDNDSISNAVEYVIGGNPASQSNWNLLPTVTLVTADPDNNSVNENYLLFTYRRTDLARNDPRTNIRCEWSTTLTGTWNNAVGTAGAVIIEDPNAVGANFGIVRVFIPRTHAVNGKLFGRLSVTIANP